MKAHAVLPYVPANAAAAPADVPVVATFPARAPAMSASIAVALPSA